MNDTTKEIEKKVQEMFRMKSPLERFKMGCSMYETSKMLVKRAILEEHPEISERELRQELFVRFYKDDFSSEQLELILSHLASL